MRGLRALAVFLVLIGAAVMAAPVASASERTPFAARITEDFCGPDETCGTARTSVGRATVHTVITNFVPLPLPVCFRDEHTSTLTYPKGSTLVMEIVGTLCGTPFGNFLLTGTYSVANGTGRFAGAGGRGLVSASRLNGPIHAVLVGTLTVPAR